MLTVVIILGVIIVIGMIVVVVTIANRLGSSGTAREAAGAGGGFGVAELSLPAGCEVIETVTAGDRLVLRLGRGSRCNQILIVDITTGALRGRLDLVPAAE